MPDRFLTAADLGETAEGAAHKTVMLDAATGEPCRPERVAGLPVLSESGLGRWNLDLGGIDPVLTLYGRHSDAVPVDLPRFDVGPDRGRRGRPPRRARPSGSASTLVTTVFDLLMAQYAVRRDGLPGEWPAGYDDASAPGTPAWQEPITSVPGRRGGPGGAGSSPATPSCPGAGR